jgi:hypothetical protein
MPALSSGLRAAFFCIVVAAQAAAAAPPLSDTQAELDKVELQLAAVGYDPQLIFTRGMLLATQGKPLLAADVFRQMLARDPGLLRPRLELARVLMLADDLQGARYHFEQVLAHELPGPVRRNVIKMLARIREELPSFTVSIELMSDSNPRQATADEEVVIDGLVYHLNNDALAESATGLCLTLGGRYPIPGASMWFARGQAEHQEYEGNGLDFSYLQAAAGRHFRIDRHTLTLEGGYHQAWFQHEPLYAGAVLQLVDFWRLRPDLSIQANLSGLRLDYQDYAYRSSWQTTAKAALVYASAPDSRWELHAAYTFNDASERPYSYVQPKIGLRYIHEWSGGWITGLGVSANRSDYSAPDPFFGEARKERELDFEADLINRRIRIWRMSPRLIVGHVNHASNLDFYTWSRTYFRLGMSGDF